MISIILEDIIEMLLYKTVDDILSHAKPHNLLNLS